MKMITWYIGVNTHFLKNTGKNGKYFSSYLEPGHWDMLLKTYTSANIEQTWQAMLTMCNLYRITAIQVASYFGFEYPLEDDENVTTHLQHVRKLPVTAKEIY